jgi:L-lactate dehydrogenase
MADARYPIEPLAHFTSDLLAAAGLESQKAQTVAHLLVMTDMLGRRTHGVALCPLYVEQLEKGLMTPRGEPECVRDNGAVVVWDGNYLPGLWLVQQALGIALERVVTYGVVTFAMRRSHHIACLATLVKQATDRGCVAILATSDPAFGFVAPYGGREPLLTPNPFAIGYPGTRTPVLVDICASITTVSMAREKTAAGQEFEHPWLLDAEGRPTRDPRVLEQTEPRGRLLLLGGLEYGHKGFGLALMVEALTQGLSGLGRRTPRSAGAATSFCRSSIRMPSPAARPFWHRWTVLPSVAKPTHRCAKAYRCACRASRPSEASRQPASKACRSRSTLCNGSADWPSGSASSCRPLCELAKVRSLAPRRGMGSIKEVEA